MKKIPQDIIGNIAILKFPRRTFWIVKKFKSRAFLKNNKSVETVLEKVGGFSGKLRTPTTKYLAGLKTKEATYAENNCVFKFNIDKTYFSPRLSNERKIVSEEIVKLSKKSGTKILVMFAGIAPYPIVIANSLKKSGKTATIISNDLNKDANEYAKTNIVINKFENYISVVGGDAKNLSSKINYKFDIILMPRPNLDDTFLKTALTLSKKGTTIFYYGFGTKEKVLMEIKREAGKHIGRIQIDKAGDISAYKFRWRAKFKVK